MTKKVGDLVLSKKEQDTLHRAGNAAGLTDEHWTDPWPVVDALQFKYQYKDKNSRQAKKRAHRLQLSDENPPYQSPKFRLSFEEKFAQKMTWEADLGLAQALTTAAAKNVNTLFDRRWPEKTSGHGSIGGSSTQPTVTLVDNPLMKSLTEQLGGLHSRFNRWKSLPKMFLEPFFSFRLEQVLHYSAIREASSCWRQGSLRLA